MSRKRYPDPLLAYNDADAVLATMSADELRQVVRNILLELDKRDHGHLINLVIRHTARSKPRLLPPKTIKSNKITEVLEFVKAAKRIGYANPSEVDKYLGLGSSAFAQEDYAAARQILGALLGPIGEAEIDLGQEELVEEVLETNIGERMAEYAVSVYMLSSPAERATAVYAAINEIRNLDNFWSPIEEMEGVAFEPLPELDDFLRDWRDLLARKITNARRDSWDKPESKWLREVVKRLEGADGLAKLARSTKRFDDLQAWCKSLVDARDWKAALPAFEEAAGLIKRNNYEQGQLLSGAALAAQELGRSDLPKWLERAWRASPSMQRLRCWLSSAKSQLALQKVTAAALEACPKPAIRQRALLHVLQSDFKAAAKILAAAPGQEWSHQEHPGHLLFPLFVGLLSGKKKVASPRFKLLLIDELDIDEFGEIIGDGSKPKLKALDVEQILKIAGVSEITHAEDRSTVLTAMRKATESRLAGVTQKQRRQQYGHAAELVALCAAYDPSEKTEQWIASIRTKYRRFLALKAELNQSLESL